MNRQAENNKTRVISNDFYFAEVQRILDDGKEVRIRVKGSSMRPFISDGDTVLLRAYNGETLRKGCNILARHEGKYVFHRFVGRAKGKLILAGDGNLVLCEYVNKGDVIAIASLHFPKDGSKAINIGSCWSRLRGLSWYHMRLFRRVFAKWR